MERELGLLSLWTGVEHCGPAAGCLYVQVAGSFSEECGTPEAAPRDLEAAVMSSSSPHCLQPVVLEAPRGMALWWRNFLVCLFVCLFLYVWMFLIYMYDTICVWRSEDES